MNWLIIHIFCLAFKDPDEMYDTLENDNGIDGILEEFFIGTESVRMRNMSKKLSVIKFFGHKRPFGVAYWYNLFANENIADCFSHVIKIRHNEVLKTTINYTRATRVNICVKCAVELYGKHK